MQYQKPFYILDGVNCSSIVTAPNISSDFCPSAYIIIDSSRAVHYLCGASNSSALNSGTSKGTSLKLAGKLHITFCQRSSTNSKQTPHHFLPTISDNFKTNTNSVVPPRSRLQLKKLGIAQRNLI